MNTTAVFISSTIAMILVLIGTVYGGLYFSKKSAERRRKLQEQQQRNSENKNEVTS